MSMVYGSKLDLEPGSWMEAAFDVYIGVVVGARHFVFLFSKTLYALLVAPLLKFLPVRKPQSVDLNTNIENNNSTQGLKVVAVGYGRTGTYSVTLALEELGYPTLHTQHLYENEDIFNMWTNDIFLPSIHNGTRQLGRPNLQLIAKQYTATADLPMALYYEQVLREYPDCKFILTTRENSEIWFRSWNTLATSITQPTQLGGIFFSKVQQYSYYLRWLFAQVNQDDAFLTASDFASLRQNKQAAIASYEQHNRRVRATIPSRQLLEYSVKNGGWQPLCEFLKVANCPQTAFPKTNSARSVQVQSISAFIAPVVIVSFVVFTMVAVVVQTTTGASVVQYSHRQVQRLGRFIGRIMMGETNKIQYTTRKSHNSQRPKAA